MSPSERKPIGSIDKTESEMIHEMYLRLVGDGTEDNPGLTVEVDRLKQFVKNVKWAIYTAGGVVITAIVGWFISAFKAGK